MDVVLSELLGDTHAGMKMSASGALSQSSRVLKAVDETGLAFSLDELNRHLHELGKRFYSGDVKVVDEFLQLYCLADNRPGGKTQSGGEKWFAEHNAASVRAVSDPANQ